ncbi:MAG: ATP-binding protein [Chloroflexota bacterium]
MTLMLRIAAELNNLPAIRRFVQETATALAAPARAIDDLVLAVDESTTNIIEHGYCGQPGDIEIEVGRAGETVVVHLRDQAPPFDPTRLPDPDLTLSLEDRPVGRMGVFLTRQLVDAVTYRLTSQGGNELTLTKKTATPQPTSQEIPHEHDH